ncbi:MAG: urea ABC transporter substrate-binding protein [Verrucomicrobiales bacterium]
MPRRMPSNSRAGKTGPNHLLSRRGFLARGGAAAIGAAGSVVGQGCRREEEPEPIKVGILHSQTGTMAISETSLRDMELFAIEEINAAGGVLGRMLEPVVKDTRSRFEDLFPKRARELLVEEHVDVVFGCWTSVSRKAVQPVFERHGGLLFYPLQYEGNECSPNIVYTGSLPSQQVIPAVDWLRSLSGGAKRRFFIVGADYVFPWTLDHVIGAHLEATYPDTEIVGRVYRPFGHQDFEAVVGEIVASGADVVINAINGDSNLYFYNELARQGVRASDIPVLATSIGEDELRGLLPEVVEGHLAAWNYFQRIDTGRNRRFVEAFQLEHGEDRVVSDPMESAYAAVYLWKSAVELAGSPDPNSVRAALARGIQFDAPGGLVRVDPRNQHVTKRCRVGRIRSDRQFDIVYEAPRVLTPDPFPQDAFPGWRCDWTRGGLIEGAPVDVSP